MIIRFIVTCCLPLVLLTASCDNGIDLAEDGTRRGMLSFVGSTEKNGKEYVVFFYNRTEATDEYNASTIRTYYLLTYTVDAQTGKVVYKTEYEPGESPGEFAGMSDRYIFFNDFSGMCAIDIFRNNSTIQTPALFQLIERKNPDMKGRIVTLITDTDKNLEVGTTTGDQYVLRVSDLKAVAASTNLGRTEPYKLHYLRVPHADDSPFSAPYGGYQLNDSTLIAMTSLNENNPHEKMLYRCTFTKQRTWVETSLVMNAIGTQTFLDGVDVGAKDSVVYVTYRTEVGAGGKDRIGAFDWQNRKFTWDKPLTAFYKPIDALSRCNIAWNAKTTAFFTWPSYAGYVPVNYVDARTGKIKWTF